MRAFLFIILFMAGFCHFKFMTEVPINWQIYFCLNIGKFRCFANKMSAHFSRPKNVLKLNPTLSEWIVNLREIKNTKWLFVSSDFSRSVMSREINVMHADVQSNNVWRDRAALVNIALHPFPLNWKNAWQRNQYDDTIHRASWPNAALNFGKIACRLCCAHSTAVSGKQEGYDNDDYYYY